MSSSIATVSATGADQFPASTPGRRLAMLYIHVPFCHSRCGFCDWVQDIPTQDLLRRPGDSVRRNYVEALCREIETQGEQLTAQGMSPRVMYWGGGTASSLSTTETTQIMTALGRSFDLNEVIESTIECSPDTVDQDRLEFYRGLGFTRVSSGVQSFDDERLGRLGRRHDAAQAVAAVRAARAAGFEDVSLDIMSGFPDQDQNELRRTVETALSLPVNHLSLYSFRPTSGTHLRRKLDPSEKHDLLRRQKLLFTEGRHLINATGMQEYASGYFGKPSAFAVMYFQMRADSVGFGSGAVSLVNQRFRMHRRGLLHAYIADPNHFDVDTPAGQDRALISYLQASLSYFEGIRRDTWELGTGTDLAEVLDRPAIKPLADFLRHRGLVEDESGIRMPAESVGVTLLELAFEMAMSQTEVRVSA